MNRYDAEHVIKEIKSIPYYQHKLVELKGKLDIVQEQIDNATVPRSPQGIEQTGAANVPSFSGKEAYLNLKITEKDKLTKKYAKFTDRFSEAQVSYFKIIDQTEEKDYVVDYFSRKYSMKELEDRYNITRAYRKIRDIIMDCTVDMV